MLWFWFTIGLILTILGAFIYAYDDDISISACVFDSDILGGFLASIGGILAVLMLFALGVNWVFGG